MCAMQLFPEAHLHEELLLILCLKVVRSVIWGENGGAVTSLSCHMGFTVTKVFRMVRGHDC